MSKPVYRQSAIKDALHCGLQYQWKHIDGLQSPGNSSRTVGSVVDETINHVCREKIAGRQVSLEEAKDFASTEFERRRVETIWGAEEPADQMKDSAIAIIWTFMNKVEPTLEPETVQESFKIEFNDFSLIGTMDYTTKDGKIHDAKTASPQRVNSYRAERLLQPAMYTYGYEFNHGKPSTGFQFDVITRVIGKAPEYHQIVKTVTPQDLQFLFYTIEHVHKMVTAGVFLPAAEGSFLCSKKWCSFWDRCKGKK